MHNTERYKKISYSKKKDIRRLHTKFIVKSLNISNILKGPEKKKERNRVSETF